MAAPHVIPTPLQQRIAWTFVAGQFGLLAVIVLWPAGSAWATPAWWQVLAGVVAVAGLVVMVVAALGLGRGLSAAPLPNGRAQLRTGGLYALVRHPIYSGLLAFAVSRTSVSGSVVVAVACLALVALLTAKARWEEARLSERFPDYPAYAARTPRFLPMPWRRGATPGITGS